MTPSQNAHAASLALSKETIIINLSRTACFQGCALFVFLSLGKKSLCYNTLLQNYLFVLIKRYTFATRFRITALLNISNYNNKISINLFKVTFMKKKHLLFIALAVASLAGQASADELTAQQALNRFLSGTTDRATVSKMRRAQAVSKMSLAYTSKVSSRNTFYVYNNTMEGGYVILSADDKMPTFSV